MQDLDTTLDAVSTRLEAVLSRLASRYRSMPESKLLGRLPDGRSRAAAGHELASLIALAAQGVEDRCRPVPPAWRALPYEGPFVVGDQIGVTGHDLLAAFARLGERASTANRAGRVGEVGEKGDGWAGAAGTAGTARMSGAARTAGAAGAAGTGVAGTAVAVAVWAPPGVRSDRAGLGTILGRVLGAAEELAAGI